MATFTLPMPDRPVAVGRRRRRTASLTGDALLKNVLWFTRLRWVVVAVLLVLEAVVHAAGPGLPLVGAYLAPLRFLPAAVAAVLALCNVGYAVHARTLRSAPQPGAAYRNLWIQIVVDLAILTVVVHRVGSVETFLPFAYLFHCVLACIFLSRRDSFYVVLIAALLYIACVALEQAGVIAASGILRQWPDISVQRTPPYARVQVASALVTWGVVWYLASRLAEDVRARDLELRLANERLVEAGLDRARHMLRTTHELKAPFAAIHTNAQLLLRGSCGRLTPASRSVVERIQARANKLSAQILEMLQLANLRSDEAPEPRRLPVNLTTVLRRVIRAAEVASHPRRIRFEKELADITVPGVEAQIEMMLANIVSNAHIYSHEGGAVTIRLARGADGRAELTIADHGIGIRPEKLPRIFEEYFHTAEAVRHNPMSTGLGLAIVRHVAEAHRIEVAVESEPDRGTTFVFRFPLV
jgi:two-component system phosphate regulon sensor histidine kinase PhoR